MGRPRKHSTAAAKQRAYRLLRRAVALEPERYETLASGWGLLDLDLVPLQRRFLADVMRPNVSIGALCTPRSVGKTTLLGRLAGLSLVPGSPMFREGLETVMVAGSMRQCRHLFRASKAVLGDLDRFKVRDNNQEISLEPKVNPLGVKLSIYPSSGKRALGLGAGEGLFIADEPASWETRSGALLWSALETSLGKLPDQKLIVCGTLSPAAVGSWWPELVKRGSHGRTVVHALTAPPDTPWDDLRLAYRLNPLTRKNTALREVIRDERDKARSDPALRPQYEAFRLNRLVDQHDELLLTIEEWDRACVRPVPPRDDSPVVIGIDVGMNRSWSAAWITWRSGRQEALAVVPGIPNLDEQARRDGLPRGLLAELVDAGSVVVDEGKRVASVRRLLDALPPDLMVEKYIADRFLEADLLDEVDGSVEIVVLQWSSASRCIAGFRRAVLDGPFSPAPESRRLMELGLAHATVDRDTSGNCRLLKVNARKRDDVAQAGILAVSAMASLPEPASYEVVLA